MVVLYGMVVRSCPASCRQGRPTRASPSRTSATLLKQKEQSLQEQRPDPQQEQLRNIARRLEKAKKSSAPSSDSTDRPVDQALKISLEVVVPLALSTAVGIGLDRWLDTKPIFLLVFFFLGVGAGMLNIYKLVKRSQMRPR